MYLFSAQHCGINYFMFAFQLQTALAQDHVEGLDRDLAPDLLVSIALWCFILQLSMTFGVLGCVQGSVSVASRKHREEIVFASLLSECSSALKMATSKNRHHLQLKEQL